MAQIRHKELWKKSCHVVRTCSLRPCVLDQVVFQHIPSFTIHHIHELGVTWCDTHVLTQFPRFHTKDELQTSGSLGTKVIQSHVPWAVLPLASCRANAATSFLSERATVARARLMGGARLHWLHYHPLCRSKKNTLHYLVNKRMNKRIDKNSVLCVFFLFCGYLCYLFCRHRGV